MNATTKTYTTERARVARPTTLGLSTGDIAQLKDFFRWHASTCGFRSGQGAFEASCHGITGGGAGNTVDEQLATTVDSRNYHDGRRVERALRLMTARGEGWAVTVLFLLYGEHPVGARDYAAAFADVWPIAHLTDAAEAVRETMALHEGNARDAAIDHAYDETEDQRLAGLETLFWECAGRIARCEAILASPRAKPLRRLEAEQKLDGWWKTAETTLKAFLGDGGRLRARLTAIGSADRELSAMSALRRRLRYSGPVDAKGKPNKDAFAAWEQAKAAWTASVRIEADQLRARASSAYRSAREATRS